MGFASEDEVKNAMRSLLKLSEYAPLPPYWHDIVSRSTSKGRGDIISGMLERGYTIGQVENWDRLYDYHLDQARYWCLVEGAAFHDYPLDYADRFDHRGKLGSIVLATDSEHTEPNRGASKLVQGGRMNTDDDVWRMDDRY